LDHFGESVGDLDAAALDADEHQALGTIIALEDLVSHPRDRARDSARVEKHYGGRGHSPKYARAPALAGAAPANQWRVRVVLGGLRGAAALRRAPRQIHLFTTRAEDLGGHRTLDGADEAAIGVEQVNAGF